MRAIARVIVPIICAASIASCGGGGVQNGTMPQAPIAPTNASRLQVTFRIDVPAKTGAAHARHPQYLSPATTQMSIDIRQSGVSISGYPTTVPLTPTSGGCTSTLATTYCQLAVSLAPGAYTATLTAEDASANALSSAQTVPFTVAAATNNIIPLTLSGIPVALAVAPGARAVHGSEGAGLTLYGSAAQPVIITARDRDGNIIVGPGSPTYTISLISGSGWSAAAPAAAAPNTTQLTPPGVNGSGAVFSVTAVYGDATCSQPGALCTATFSVKNDVQMLFVANGNASTVTEYAPPYTGAPTTISSGINVPYKLTMDGAANLFVANVSINTVTEYAPPYTGAPVVAVNTVSGNPYDIALDANRDLFVANLHANTVTEFVPPYTGVATTTISSGVNLPVSLVFDAAGDLFVANAGALTVTEYAPPYTGAPIKTISVAGSPAEAMDAAGDLFVSETTNVTEFAPPYSGATRTVSTGVSAASALLLDGAGDLFVADAGSNTATEYGPPYTGAPITMSVGSQAFGLAIDGMGDIFVANFGSNSVTEYAPPYAGTPTIISTGVSGPYAVILTP